MSQAFTPVEQELMRRLVSVERELTNLKSGVGQGLPLMTAKASAPLVLTGTDAVVPGTAVGITKPGRYFAIASADIPVTVAAASNLVHLSIQAAGAGFITFDLHGFHPMDSAILFNTRVTMAVFNFTGPGTLAIFGRKSGGTVTIESVNGATGLVVMRFAPV